MDRAGEERTVTIVGVDEAEPLAGKISWISLRGARADQGARRRYRDPSTPGGVEELEILELRYPDA